MSRDLSDAIAQASKHRVQSSMRPIQTTEEMLAALANGYVVQVPFPDSPFGPAFSARAIVGYDPETDRVLASDRWGNSMRWMPRAEAVLINSPVLIREDLNSE